MWPPVATARVTTAAGLYVLAPLPPGQYNVQLTASGFQAQSLEGITVDALQTISLDLTMKVGTAAEQVTVEAAAPALRTEDVSLGQTMQNKVYNALPLAMSSGVRAILRSLSRLLREWPRWSHSPPGLPTPLSMGRSRRPTACIWKGRHDLSEPERDTRPLALGFPSKLWSNSRWKLTARRRSGRGRDSQLPVESGTNQFHGASTNIRNTVLDARGFLRPLSPWITRTSSAGRWRADRQEQNILFQQLQRLLLQHVFCSEFHHHPVDSVPEWRFQRSAGGNYDPTTLTCAGAICSKTPFANNIIPANRISGVSKSFQSYLPPPTNGNITNNFLGALPGRYATGIRRIKQI